MIRWALPALALLAGALPAGVLLAGAQAQAASDPRLASRPYRENEVVRIDGRLGVQATIAFAEDELIENVAIGDSAKWQVTPNKRANLLFVKPLEAEARTNMTVVTDRRSYFFDLVASAKAKPVYLLRFSYPEEDRRAAGEKAREERQLALNEIEQSLLAADPAAAPVDPALLDLAWERKGDAELMPARIHDDGNATYLAWPARQAIPAILVSNEKGEEGPVNYAVRQDVIVIDGVPDRIILRSGKALATLTKLRDKSGSSRATASQPAPAQPPSNTPPKRN